MTLKEVLSSDVQDVFLDTDEFAESDWTFYAKDGGPSRSITVITVETGNIDEGDMVAEEVEFINVFVERNETTGIDEIHHGAKIRKATDNPDEFWHYSGEVIEKDTDIQVLQFIRRTQIQRGTSQVRINR